MGDDADAVRGTGAGVPAQAWHDFEAREEHEEFDVEDGLVKYRY